MLIEISDNKIPAIMKGLQSMCREYLEYDDTPPGIGKTENEFTWFEYLSDIIYDQVQHKVVVVFENLFSCGAIDSKFSELQRMFGITAGDITPEQAHEFDEARTKLVKVCAKILMDQI